MHGQLSKAKGSGGELMQVLLSALTGGTKPGINPPKDASEEGRALMTDGS